MAYPRWGEGDETAAATRPSWSGADCFRALFAILLASWTAAGAATAAGGATASASFCNDSDQLQDWFAQGEQPGLDQYDYAGYPDLSVIQPEANYLEKLSAEAPQSTQPTFSNWANFAKAVEEDTATAISEKSAAPPGLTSWPALASQVQSARFAATLIQKWFKSDSGCKQLYVTESDPAKGGHGINRLWFVGGGFLVLILLGAIFGSSGDDESVPNHLSSASSDSSSTKRKWEPYEPPESAKPKRKCPTCNGMFGPGKVQCYACGGLGTIETFHEGVGYTHDRCGQCYGNRFIPCNGCNGSGELNY